MEFFFEEDAVGLKHIGADENDPDSHTFIVGFKNPWEDEPIKYRAILDVIDKIRINMMTQHPSQSYTKMLDDLPWNTGADAPKNVPVLYAMLNGGFLVKTGQWPANWYNWILVSDAVNLLFERKL